MAADQYCLKWNNHQSTLLVQFETLLESDSLTDCTLSAEGKYLNVHKVLLSACSPYFSKLLGEHKDKHPIFFMKDVAFEELKGIVEYMYKGEVNVMQERLDSFLKTASSLQIKGLADQDGGKGEDREEDPGGGRAKRKQAPDLRGGYGESSPMPEEPPRSPKRRRRPRPVSQDDSLPAQDQNHCDTTTAPAFSQLQQQEVVMPTPLVPVKKTEPVDNSMVHLKTEIPDDVPQVDVQDLTLDDDEDFNNEDITQPGTSFSETSQDFAQWQQQMATQSGADESFMAATQGINQSGSQGDKQVEKNGYRCKCGKVFTKLDHFCYHVKNHCGKNSEAKQQHDNSKTSSESNKKNQPEETSKNLGEVQDRATITKTSVPVIENFTSSDQTPSRNSISEIIGEVIESSFPVANTFKEKPVTQPLILSQMLKPSVTTQPSGISNIQPNKTIINQVDHLNEMLPSVQVTHVDSSSAKPTDLEKNVKDVANKEFSSNSLTIERVQVKSVSKDTTSDIDPKSKDTQPTSVVKECPLIELVGVNRLVVRKDIVKRLPGDSPDVITVMDDSLGPIQNTAVNDMGMFPPPPPPPPPVLIGKISIRKDICINQFPKENVANVTVAENSQIKNVESTIQDTSNRKPITGTRPRAPSRNIASLNKTSSNNDNDIEILTPEATKPKTMSVEATAETAQKECAVVNFNSESYIGATTVGEVENETTQSPSRVNRLTVRKDISRVPAQTKQAETETSTVAYPRMVVPVVSSETSSTTGTPTQALGRISVRTDITKRITAILDKNIQISQINPGTSFIKVHNSPYKLTIRRDDQTLQHRSERIVSIGESPAGFKNRQADNAEVPPSESQGTTNSSRCENTATSDINTPSDSQDPSNSRGDRGSQPDKQVTQKSKNDKIVSIENQVPHKAQFDRNFCYDRQGVYQSGSQTRQDRQYKAVLLTPYKKKNSNFIKSSSLKKFRSIQPAGSAPYNRGSYDKSNNGTHLRAIAPAPNRSSVLRYNHNTNQRDKQDGKSGSSNEPSQPEQSATSGESNQPQSTHSTPSNATIIFPGASLASNSLVSALFPGADFSKNTQFSNSESTASEAVNEPVANPPQMVGQKRKNVKKAKEKHNSDFKKKKIQKERKDRKKNSKDRITDNPKPNSDVIDLCEDSRSILLADPLAQKPNNNPTNNAAKESDSVDPDQQPSTPATSASSSDASRPQPLMSTNPSYIPQVHSSSNVQRAHYYSSDHQRGGSRPYHYKPHNKHYQRDRKFHKKKSSSWHIPTQNY